MLHLGNAFAFGSVCIACGLSAVVCMLIGKIGIHFRQYWDCCVIQWGSCMVLCFCRRLYYMPIWSSAWLPLSVCVLECVQLVVHECCCHLGNACAFGSVCIWGRPEQWDVGAVPCILVRLNLLYLGIASIMGACNFYVFWEHLCLDLFAS